MYSISSFGRNSDYMNDCSIVLALLQVALFLGRVITKDWFHGVGHSPVCQILSQIVVIVVITSSPPIWTKRSYIVVAFPFFPQ